MGQYSGQRWLVVGLGKSGSSAVRYLRQEGASVVATDSRAAAPGLGEARALGAEVFAGGFAAPQPHSQFSGVCLSPGVAPQEPFVRSLAAAGVEIVGDVELFARDARIKSGASVIGITGANGKSTVTTLVGDMAKQAGVRVAVGGNLGTPALDLLSNDVELYVLELSSFQLETIYSLRCKAATVLNLSQDHLDRHGSMEAYAEAKARIYNGCEVAVVNREDRETWRHSTSAAKLLSFGVAAPPRQAGEYGLIEERDDLALCVCDAGGEIAPLLSVRQLQILGLHNTANALAALALADAAGLPREASRKALMNFTGLPHRCQRVGERNGIQFVNDSKGTNVGATVAALAGMPRPIVWLGGGQGKGQDFTPLARPLADRGRFAVLFGQDAPAIEEAIFGALPVYREADLDAAMARVQQVAVPGDWVLLSPACASLDQFRNYEERGQRFCEAVQKFSAEASA